MSLSASDTPSQTTSTTQSVSLSSSASRSLSGSPTSSHFESLSATTSSSQSVLQSQSHTSTGTSTPSPSISGSLSLSASETSTPSHSESASNTRTAAPSESVTTSVTTSSSVVASATASQSSSSVSDSPSSTLTSASKSVTPSTPQSVSQSTSGSPSVSVSSTATGSSSVTPAPSLANVDCEIATSWSAWSSCIGNSTCASWGLKLRHLPIVRFAAGNGQPCPAQTTLQEVIQCVLQPDASCVTCVNANGPGTSVCGEGASCGLCCEGQACDSDADCGSGLLCGSSFTCIAASVASAEIYVQDHITLIGVDASLLSDSGVVSAIKASVQFHLSQWDFVDTSLATVSVLKTVNVGVNASCSLVVQNSSPISMTTGCDVFFVVRASSVSNALLLSQSLSSNIDSLSRKVQQDLSLLLPGLCSVITFIQNPVTRIVTSNDHPLVLPSPSRLPNTSLSPTSSPTVTPISVTLTEKEHTINRFRGCIWSLLVLAVLLGQVLLRC